jgi:Glycosyl hydrolase catalytic core
MNKLGLGAALLLIATLVACGGGSVVTTTPPPPPAPPTISATVTVSSAVIHPFDLAMSTSFQPAEWDYTFLQQFPGALTPLRALNPSHIRLQGISQGVPQGLNGTSSTSWDFSTLDSIGQPVLSVGDHSPEFQIAKGPGFMYQNNDNNSTNNIPNSFLDLTFQQFAGYAKNLVQYYNTGGFTPPGGKLLVSPAYPNDKITWWGIYNEPSINNNLTATDYVTMYNAVVPAMQSADANIKFVALEMCCSSEDWATTFAQNVTPGLPVDAVASHYYSSCDQKDTDAQVMGTVPGFASSVQTIRSNLSNANPALATVPIWITENNVNADFDAGNGMSACNPGQTFVDDLRGSDAFFAAWRPYVFSQVGKAGVQLLYHWDFAADAQFGELNGSTGQTQLSYWVDYWLGQMFPPGPIGRLILETSNTDTPDVEELAVLNTDQSVVVLISNHAVASPDDNNGAGVSAKVTLDVSALGNFAAASLVTIDANTSATTGPSPVAISTASPIELNMNGYSVAMIKLQ